jgi:hypothetical protein
MESQTQPADSFPMFRELLSRPDLSRAAVLIYGVLATLDTGAGVTITVRELSAISGLSPFERRKGGLRRYIKTLEARGLISKSEPDGRALRYYVRGPKALGYQPTVLPPSVTNIMSE